MLTLQISGSYTANAFSGIFFRQICPLTARNCHTEKMQSLLETAPHSDVTLLVGATRREFKVHRGQLSVHSSVFRAMFSHKETKEALEEKVIIEDVSPEVMHRLLAYIYTAEVEFAEEEDKEAILECLIAADKVRNLLFSTF